MAQLWIARPSHTMRQKAARVCLAIAVVWFILGAFLQGDISEWFIISAAFALVAVFLGVRLVRIIGVVLVLASIVMTIGEFQVEQSLKARVMKIRQKISDSPVKLTPEQFIGHSLSLISDTQVEQYNFKEGGAVRACLGTKDLATGPAFYWKIVNGHTLVITDTQGDKNTVIISYEFRSLTDKNAVTMAGKRFERSRNNN